MTKKKSSQRRQPVDLAEDALDAATGGAAHELALVVQQDQTVQYNPKER